MVCVQPCLSLGSYSARGLEEEALDSGPVPGQQTRSEAETAVIVYSSNMSTKRPEPGGFNRFPVCRISVAAQQYSDT
jgi:hypothetical protein